MGFMDFVKEKRKLDNNGCVLESNESVLSVPSITLQYLLCINGIPLGRVIEIVGESSSNKSSLIYFLARLFASANGFAAILETEGTTYSNKKEALVDYEDNVYSVLVTSIEDWQGEIFEVIKRYKKDFENLSEAPPLMLAIDSIIGTLDDRSQEKIFKDKCIKPTFSSQPRQISEFLKFVCSNIVGLNATLFLVNHEYKFNDPITGVLHRTIPGGERQKYMSSIIIELSKLKGSIRYSNRVENVIKFLILKNRFGIEKMQVTIPWVYYYGKNVNICFFDLAKADVLFLTNEMVGIPSDQLKLIHSKVKQVINVKYAKSGRGGKLYYCDELNISKNDALPYFDFVKKLWENETIMNDLRDVLQIRKLDSKFASNFDINLAGDSDDDEGVEEE